MPFPPLPLSELTRFGTVPLPKSDTPGRIQANADLWDFELDEADMKQMEKLDEGYAVSWNPVNVE